jgi:hypothetical protein
VGGEEEEEEEGEEGEALPPDLGGDGDDGWFEPPPSLVLRAPALLRALRRHPEQRALAEEGEAAEAEAAALGLALEPPALRDAAAAAALDGNFDEVDAHAAAEGEAPRLLSLDRCARRSGAGAAAGALALHSAGHPLSARGGGPLGPFPFGLEAAHAADLASSARWGSLSARVAPAPLASPLRAAPAVAVAPHSALPALPRASACGATGAGAAAALSLAAYALWCL